MVGWNIRPHDRGPCEADAKQGTASECTDLTAGKPDKNGLQWEGSYDWIDFLHYYVLQESRRILLKLSRGSDEVNLQVTHIFLVPDLQAARAHALGFAA